MATSKLILIFVFLTLAGFTWQLPASVSSSTANHLTAKKMQKEIWKDVPGYEGMYQVSNLGNVKSLSRKIYRKDSNRVHFILKERFLKPAIDSAGYRTVALHKYGQKSNKVSVLVAIAFLKHNPDGYVNIVDHINEDKTDDRLINLQIISNRENISRSMKNGTSKYTGVSWATKAKKWKSAIHINGKRKNIGYFKTELEAHKAYQLALTKL